MSLGKGSHVQWQAHTDGSWRYGVVASDVRIEVGVPVVDCTSDTFGGSAEHTVPVETSRLQPRTTCFHRHVTGRRCEKRIDPATLRHDGDHERSGTGAVLVERWATPHGRVRWIHSVTLEEHVLRVSGPSGGRPQFRLDRAVGEEIAAWQDAGRGEEARAMLAEARERWDSGRAG